MGLGGTKDENLSNYIKGTVGLRMMLLDKDSLLYLIGSRK